MMLPKLAQESRNIPRVYDVALIIYFPQPFKLMPPMIQLGIVRTDPQIWHTNLRCFEILLIYEHCPKLLFKLRGRNTLFVVKSHRTELFEVARIPVKVIKLYMHCHRPNLTPSQILNNIPS